jgi:hypothetical protein
VQPEFPQVSGVHRRSTESARMASVEPIRNPGNADAPG